MSAFTSYLLDAKTAELKLRYAIDPEFRARVIEAGLLLGSHGTKREIDALISAVAAIELFQAVGAA